MRPAPARRARRALTTARAARLWTRRQLLCEGVRASSTSGRRNTRRRRYAERCCRTAFSSPCSASAAGAAGGGSTMLLPSASTLSTPNSARSSSRGVCRPTCDRGRTRHNTESHRHKRQIVAKMLVARCNVPATTLLLVCGGACGVRDAQRSHPQQRIRAVFEQEHAVRIHLLAGKPRGGRQRPRARGSRVAARLHAGVRGRVSRCGRPSKLLAVGRGANAAALRASRSLTRNRRGYSDGTTRETGRDS